MEALSRQGSSILPSMSYGHQSAILYDTLQLYMCGCHFQCMHPVVQKPPGLTLPGSSAAG